MRDKLRKLYCNQASSSARIVWLDVVRGILILSVVIGHNIQFGSGKAIQNDFLFFEDPVFRFIYSFHMPCFMLLSGFFQRFGIDKHSFWKYRIQTILIPAIVWSTLPEVYSLLRSVVNRNFSVTLFISSVEIIPTHFWFLWAGFFCSIIVWLGHHYFQDSPVLFIVIGIVLLFIPDWLNTELWKFMYPYFVTGYYLNRKKIDFVWAKERKWGVLIVLIIGYLVLLTFYTTESYVYTTGIFVKDIRQLCIDIYRYLIGFVGSFMIIWAVYIFYPLLDDKIHWINTILAYCGRISLSIYIIDGIINGMILPKITNDFNLDYGIVFAEMTIILIICACGDWLIKRVPIARRLLLGSR